MSESDIQNNMSSAAGHATTLTVDTLDDVQTLHVSECDGRQMEEFYKQHQQQFFDSERGRRDVEDFERENGRIKRNRILLYIVGSLLWAASLGACYFCAIRSDELAAMQGFVLGVGSTLTGCLSVGVVLFMAKIALWAQFEYERRRYTFLGLSGFICIMIVVFPIALLMKP